MVETNFLDKTAETLLKYFYRPIARVSLRLGVTNYQIGQLCLVMAGLCFLRFTYYAAYEDRSSMTEDGWAWILMLISQVNVWVVYAIFCFDGLLRFDGKAPKGERPYVEELGRPIIVFAWVIQIIFGGWSMLADNRFDPTYYLLTWFFFGSAPFFYTAILPVHPLLQKQVD